MLLNFLKNINFLYTFVFIFLLSGCFPLTSNSIKKINISDTKESVIKTLGRSYSKKAFYNKDFFVYYTHDDVTDLFINLKKFPFIGFHPILRTGNEYWIIFEDNKVVAFGEAKNFGNNIPKALNSSGATLEVVK